MIDFVHIYLYHIVIDLYTNPSTTNIHHSDIASILASAQNDEPDSPSSVPASIPPSVDDSAAVSSLATTDAESKLEEDSEEEGGGQWMQPRSMQGGEVARTRVGNEFQVTDLPTPSNPR